MIMQARDFSGEALYHPERVPVFVGHDAVPPFDVDADGSSTYGNAWWLSNFAHLAYYEGKGSGQGAGNDESGAIGAQLGRVGLKCLKFFDREGTQGYIARGERFAVLAFRGTETDELKDIITDANLILRTLRQVRRRSGFQSESLEGRAKVHGGFWKALKVVWKKDVAPVLDELANEGVPVWYTGHSLGAALATLAATRFKPAALYTFGSPRVGDEALADLLQRIPVQRFVNGCDVVTMVPPETLGYDHLGEQHFITPDDQLLKNPSGRILRRIRFRALLAYQAKLPWLRSGMVATRFLADHSIVNYTAGIGPATSYR